VADAPGLEAQRISRELRQRRLWHERANTPLAGPRLQPDIYFERSPSGDYPIVALRTVPCDKWVLGLCAPCGYSARSYPENVSREDIYASIMAQLEWLLDRFDELFVQRASGALEGYQLRPAPPRPWYTLQIAGASSFFRDAEIPPSYRRKILERLLAFQEANDINLHVMLETRPEHLVRAAESGELEVLKPLLRGLDVVVNVGYEASDSFLRNVVFAKGLEEAVFEMAMRVASSYDLDPGVFVFAGGYILTPAEVLRETQRTLDRLESMGLFANVMVPNLQSFTLPDLLFEFEWYDLPEPYILLDIAEMLLAFSPKRPRPVTAFDWFVGGLIADPLPRFTILNNPRRRTSDRVTGEIVACLDELIHTLDDARFRRSTQLLRQEPDYRWYEQQLEECDTRSWPDRLRVVEQAAAGLLDEYDARVGRTVVT
jgi:radical SAM enzyme (TIGR01210 family)